jgi:transglutaminase-like putative cysteine protease
MHGAGAMHAWVECLMPDRHWHGFDPTNGVLANSRYVKVHVGRDYDEVNPVRGVYAGPKDHRLTVRVEVTEAD